MWYLQVECTPQTAAACLLPPIRDGSGIVGAAGVLAKE